MAARFRLEWESAGKIRAREYDAWEEAAAVWEALSKRCPTARPRLYHASHGQQPALVRGEEERRR